MKWHSDGTESRSIEKATENSDRLPLYEFLDCKELASRWGLPESWIREQVRSRAPDPLPHVRFGKYVRFRWASPELEGWAERRIIVGHNRVAGRVRQKEAQ